MTDTEDTMTEALTTASPAIDQVDAEVDRIMFRHRPGRAGTTCKCRHWQWQKGDGTHWEEHRKHVIRHLRAAGVLRDSVEVPNSPDVKNYWVSWYHDGYGVIALGWPWWISGYTMEQPARTTIVAAIRATSENEAMEIVVSAYEERPNDVVWRFAEQVTEEDWTPYSDRFPKATWMTWPQPAPID